MPQPLHPAQPRRRRTAHAALLGLVLVAPARASEVTLVATRDTTLYAESGSESNGAGERFFAGVNGMGQVRRGLVAFDVAAALPAGSVVVGAELTLYMSKTNAGPQSIELHRALAGWGEGTSNASSGDGGGAPATAGDATWTLRVYPTTPWATAGGDFSAPVSATTLVDQVGFYAWSAPALAADVQAWLDQPAQNHGWLLKATNEVDAPTAKRFDSSENLTTSRRPRLRVVYAPPCAGGAVSYCTAAPNSVGAGALMGHVGAPSVTQNAFTLTCAQLPPATVSLFYSGTQTDQQPFGNGFRCVAGTLTRLNPPVTAGAGGVAVRPLDLTQPPAAGLFVPGSTHHFQCWYRNPAAGGAAFNLSDGLSVTFCD